MGTLLLMGETTIEWADYTFNPWVGCTKVSAACDHCYAETWAKRTGQPHLWQGERRRTSRSYWRNVALWNRKACVARERRRVFCASLADVFDNQVPKEWRSALWMLISTAPSLDWLLLTKRPQNIADMLPVTWGDGWPNVWLGATVENQAEADRRIPHLLRVPARVHFLSCEPLLGPIDLRPHPIDWVIAGGESGPHARPMHPDWVRSLRDQCRSTDVPFFFKQWGEWLPVYADENETWLPDDGSEGDEASRCYGMRVPLVTDGQWFARVGKKRAGALLDGREWRESADGGNPDAATNFRLTVT